MQDWYQMPVLVLTALLLPAFGYLYARTRDVRNLLWFLAFCCTLARMAVLYPAATWDMVYSSSPLAAAVGESLAILAAGLFLGSLSPLSFRIGKRRILCVIPFTVPLMIYAVLCYGPYLHKSPTESHVLGLPGAGHDFAGYRRPLGSREGYPSYLDGHRRCPRLRRTRPTGFIFKRDRIGR